MTFFVYEANRAITTHPIFWLLCKTRTRGQPPGGTGLKSCVDEMSKRWESRMAAQNY